MRIEVHGTLARVVGVGERKEDVEEKRALRIILKSEEKQGLKALSSEAGTPRVFFTEKGIGRVCRSRNLRAANDGALIR